MASRCETCLKTLGAVLGEEEMQGTTMSARSRFEAAPTSM